MTPPHPTEKDWQKNIRQEYVGEFNDIVIDNTPLSLKSKPMTHSWQEEFDKTCDLVLLSGGRKIEMANFIFRVEQSAEKRGIEKAMEQVRKHDPRYGEGTSKTYWGNTLMKALQSLLSGE